MNPPEGKSGMSRKTKPEKDRLTVQFNVRFKKSEAKAIRKLGKPTKIIRRAALRDIGVEK